MVTFVERGYNIVSKICIWNKAFDKTLNSNFQSKENETAPFVVRILHHDSEDFT